MAVREQVYGFYIPLLMCMMESNYSKITIAI